MITPSKIIEKRFWSKVDIREPDECWKWTGGRDTNGYGMFFLLGATRLAHRISYFIKNGKIPEGVHVLHHCDNKPCCNPRHLYAGTHADNMRDRSLRGRTNPTKVARLHASEIKEIRKLLKAGIPQTSIAEIFDIAKGTVSNIKLADTFPCKEGYYI